MQQKTTSPVILALIILLGFVVGYLYYASVKGEIALTPVPADADDPTFLKFKKLTFDLSVKDQLGSLKIIGEAIVSGQKGKTNLFQ